MNQPLKLNSESLEKTVRRRAENDQGEPAGMALTIPTRDGGSFSVPVLDDWQPTEEKPEGELGNTLMSVCPVAEIHRRRPIKSGGLTISGGLAVSLLRPGYLYVFRGELLWREFEVGPDGTLGEVDLVSARQDKTAPRVPVGKPVTDFLVPVFLQNRFELTDCRIAYSEIQWPWSYIETLESTSAKLNKRTLTIAPAWAAATDDSLNFDSGFPASAVTSVSALRPRDLGVELMLSDPSEFTPDFREPGSGDLISRVVERWKQIPEDDEATGQVPELNLQTESTEDALKGAREHDAIVCVAIPDPLFRLRHALAQLHLALHYLDAIELSLKDRPLIHSATLIRQGLFDSQESASSDQIQTLRAAVDQEKLFATLDQPERQKVLEDIDLHLQTLESLVSRGDFEIACDDYLNHDGLGPCETFALQADMLNLTQQFPGVLKAHGLNAPATLSRLLKHGLGKNTLIGALADTQSPDRDPHPLIAKLKNLAAAHDELTEDELSGSGLSSISVLAQELVQAGDGSASRDNSGSSSLPSGAPATAAGMVQTAVGGWSAAVLKAVDTLRQSGELGAIKLDRVFTSVKEAAQIADPNLSGELQVMLRGEIDLTRFSIIGVHGEGLSFGLTDADLKSEALTRRNDYLFADKADAAGQRVASTSPSRLVDESGEAVVKAAAHTWVFVLPVGHPEAKKFSALNIDWAKKARAFADGPALSRVLVGLAAFNLASEMWSLRQLKSGELGLSLTKSFAAWLDLSATLMKLHVVSAPRDSKLVSKVILRPLFEIKSVPLIGPLVQNRLKAVGAATIARTMGLANFLAAGFSVGISAWDCRNSLSRGDMDAAFGHGLAVAGGTVFLASPLLTGLLAIPGWGWALLGLGAVLGGSLFAAFSTDSELERILKQGPLGLGPAHEGLPGEDSVYYPQLLSQFSPVSVSAVCYGDLSSEEKAMFSVHNPSPSDYRVTVSSPLISRFKLGRIPHDGDGSQNPGLRLGIQELEYTHSVMDTPAGQVEDYYLTRNTPLKKVKSWVPAPDENAVHFLIERNLTSGENRSFGRVERRTINLRIVLQARIQSEAGSFTFPMPVLEDYEAFDSNRHSALPDKRPKALNPFNNESVPYWMVKEVAV